MKQSMFYTTIIIALAAGFAFGVLDSQKNKVEAAVETAAKETVPVPPVKNDYKLDASTSNMAETGYTLYKEKKFVSEHAGGNYTDVVPGKGSFEFWSNGRIAELDRDSDGHYETIFRIDNGNLIYIGSPDTEGTFVNVTPGMEEYLGQHASKAIKANTPQEINPNRERNPSEQISQISQQTRNKWCIARLTLACEQQNGEFAYCGYPESDPSSDMSFMFNSETKEACTMKFKTISLLGGKYQNMKTDKIYHAYVGIEENGLPTKTVLNKLYFPDGSTKESVPVDLKLGESTKKISNEERARTIQATTGKDIVDIIDPSKSEIPLKNGYKHGLVREYYKSGKLFSEAYWVDGFKHGEYRVYSEDGSLNQKGTREKNIDVGTRWVYYPNGKVEAEMEFENGETKTMKTFSPDGVIRDETRNTGDADQIILIYDKDGKLKTKRIVKNGVLSKTENFDYKGNLLSEE